MFFFEKMGMLLVSTTILIIIVIGGFFYQVRIISRLNKILQIREDFSYALIHDMKTPLSNIFMALKFLQSGRLDDKPEVKERHYRIAESEVDHLLTLTNKVLTISKLECNKLDIVKSKFELAPMLERLTGKFTIQSHKPVSFRLDLQAPEIYADGEYIEEVFSNLIDNAIKYSGERVDIHISSANNDTYTLIKVYDNGFGISEKDQRTIFNKYERGAAGRRIRKGGAAGFGLGLNFVQQVIEAHKGKIFVNSIEGEFTEVRIYLPLLIKEL